jgi:hypothetical protein
VQIQAWRDPVTARQDPRPSPAPLPDEGQPAGGDAGRWREAARLRIDHSGWVVIWLAPAAEFRAYRRLPGARRDTALAAPTATDLGAQMTQVEQAAARTSASRTGRHD